MLDGDGEIETITQELGEFGEVSAQQLCDIEGECEEGQEDDKIAGDSNSSSILSSELGDRTISNISSSSSATALNSNSVHINVGGNRAVEVGIELQLPRAVADARPVYGY